MKRSIQPGGVMDKPQPFQVRSKEDARLLAKKIQKSVKNFYYHVPLLGGMEGNFITIQCDQKSSRCEVYSSIPGSSDRDIKHSPDLAEHIWKDRRFINSELRMTESEWFGYFTVEHGKYKT